MIFAHFIDIKGQNHWIKTTEIYRVSTRTNNQGDSFTIIAYAGDTIEVKDDVEAVLQKIDGAVAS